MSSFLFGGDSIKLVKSYCLLNGLLITDFLVFPVTSMDLAMKSSGLLKTGLFLRSILFSWENSFFDLDKADSLLFRTRWQSSLS